MRYVVKHRLMVTPEVVVVGYGELPRSERKSQRVFDGRITDSVVYRAGFRGTGKVGGAKD